jgi:hypothetical protein
VSDEDADDDVPEVVVDMLTSALDPEPESLRIEDVTDLFRWVGKHRIYRGIDHERRAASVAYGEDTPLLLVDEDLAGLSELIVRERGGLPGGLEPARLAEAIRRLTQPDPMGFVGEESVLHQSVLPVEGPEVDLAKLQESRALGARPASLVQLGGGRQRLEFFYWTVAGSLEEWIVDLDDRAFVSLKRRDVEPPGSFKYPFV